MAYLAPYRKQVHFKAANVLRMIQEAKPMFVDLVIVGGSSSGGSGSEDACGLQLLRAQCCVAYRSLRPGGTLFVRMTGLCKATAAAMFCMLVDDFESVDVIGS